MYYTASDFILVIVIEMVHALTFAGTSWYASVFLVVNAGLGAGLLNFPAEYHECGGIVVAVSIQAVRFVFLHTFYLCRLICKFFILIICVYFEVYFIIIIIVIISDRKSLQQQQLAAC